MNRAASRGDRKVDSADAEKAGKMPAQPGHLHQLVDEGGAQVHRGSLQRETFVAAPDLDPVLSVIDLGVQRGNRSRASYMGSVLAALPACGHRNTHQAPAKPVGQFRTTPYGAIQTISGKDGAASIKADRVPHFRRPVGVAELRPVARGDIFCQLFHLR